MQIRVLTTPEERQSARTIWSQAFSMGEIPEEKPDGPDVRTSYGIFEGESLQAVANVIDYEITMGDTGVAKMGGIGGVACLPASRGKGYTRTNLLHALEKMREAGQITSMLFPFSYDFYRRYGWEWIGIRRKYTTHTRVFVAVPETESVRAATVSDWPRLGETYASFAKRYRGMLVRSEAKMAERLKDGSRNFTYTYLYEHEGQIEGYLVYRGGTREHVDLGEFICLTARAQRGLLGLLRRLDMQIEKVSWWAPEDDMLWSRRFTWDVNTEIWPVTQARVVDVVGALQAWKPDADGSGSVRLQVTDEYAPWNAGTWQIEFAEGKASVEPTTKSPDVTLDIQALSQAYFGTPGARQLRDADRLTMHSETGFSSLCNLFDGPTMWLNNGF